MKRPCRSALFGAMLGIAMMAVAPANPAGKSITVGSNVLVSGDRRNVHQEENVMGVDPRNPKNLIACTMDDQYTSRSGQTNLMHAATYVSFDGGSTWKLGVSAEPGGGDPLCGYGVDGTAYFLEIEPDVAYDPGGDHMWTMFIYRSPDGGHTWDPPIKTSTGDRPWMAIDRTNGPYRGSIYVASEYRIRLLTGGGPECAPRCGQMALRLRRSSDGGRTWTGTARVVDPTINALVPLNVVVFSNGTVGVLWNQAPGVGKEGAIYFATSRNGAESLGPPVKVADAPWVNDVESASGAFAIDPGSALFKDHLYAAWVDTATGRERIMFSASSDKGKHWSTPRTVDDNFTRRDGKGPDDILPELAVSPNGIVGITWYDRRNARDDTGYMPRFSASLDGGDTWLPSVPISQAPNVFGGNEEWQLWSGVSIPKTGGTQTLSIMRREWITSGHTGGLVADAHGVFHPLWVDDRTGFKQLYTTDIHVAGSVIRNGSIALSHLDDLSENVALESDGASYDRATGIVTMLARLRNVGKTTVHGPLKVRVLALDSQYAVPSILNADNGVSGSGAVWDFSRLLHGAALHPKETTGLKTLRFHLADLRPFVITPPEKTGGTAVFGLISLNVRVLGSK